MYIHFDLNSKCASFVIGEELFVCQLTPVKLSPVWSAAHMDDIVQNGRVYSVSWQVWQESTQYIQVREYQENTKKDPWLVIARWTYSANKPLEHIGIGGKVKVEGSPYGDFMS